MNVIVHICQRQKWEEALKQGLYESDSLRESGFIHASHPEQVVQVANNIFSTLPDLVLLWIDPNKVRSEIREEYGSEEDKSEIFPHIYGPLNLEAVISVQDFYPDADGVFRHLPLK